VDCAHCVCILTCGYGSLAGSQLRDQISTSLSRDALMSEAAQRLVQVLHKRLGYSEFVEVRNEAPCIP